MTQQTFSPCIRAFAPGRTEIAGNHTDHQGGKVIAATVSEGIEVLMQPNDEMRGRVSSPGHQDIDIDLTELAPVPAEQGNSAALVRGVAAGLKAADVPVAGFDARTESALASGGGLSSSAAFELGIATALDLLYGDAKTGPITRALIAQDAERYYYGKPCGLMDQASIALGGIVAMDFENPEAPRHERIDFNFAAHGYSICLIDTKSSHSDKTDDYASIGQDMLAVARAFGAERLRQVDENAFLAKLGDIRATLGDRAALRALHYYHEMRLVEARANAMRAGDIELFLQLTRLSGISSAQYLQNVSPLGSSEQPAMVALALSDIALGVHGVSRIHGGGFGGSIQAYVPTEISKLFATSVEQLLGPDTVHFIELSSKGAFAQWI